jgi:hypothetical protein
MFDDEGMFVPAFVDPKQCVRVGNQCQHKVIFTDGSEMTMRAYDICALFVGHRMEIDPHFDKYMPNLEREDDE